ncbi:hypothetical protein CEXT_591301 [Caerostris extrusa]|uniref:Uncharacterized protein n=1 Tax=Caerostris extrusa TaxID=172846 RepID=A0AAV4S1S7_CAEEX|nr:hypothetical protein CEXT_591301 [Caerostris extrusa]
MNESLSLIQTDSYLGHRTFPNPTESETKTHDSQSEKPFLLHPFYPIQFQEYLEGPNFTEAAYKRMCRLFDGRNG